MTDAILTEFKDRNQSNYDITNNEYINILELYIQELNIVSKSTYTLEDNTNFNKQGKDVRIKINDESTKISYVQKNFKKDIATIKTSMNELYNKKIDEIKSKRDDEIENKKEDIDSLMDRQIEIKTNEILNERSMQNMCTTCMCLCYICCTV